MLLHEPITVEETQDKHVCGTDFFVCLLLFHNVLFLLILWCWQAHLQKQKQHRYIKWNIHFQPLLSYGYMQTCYCPTAINWPLSVFDRTSFSPPYHGSHHPSHQATHTHTHQACINCDVTTNLGVLGLNLLRIDLWITGYYSAPPFHLIDLHTTIESHDVHTTQSNT